MVAIVTAVYREPVKNYLANFFSIWGGARAWGTKTEKFRDELSHSGLFYYIFSLWWVFHEEWSVAWKACVDYMMAGGSGVESGVGQDGCRRSSWRGLQLSLLIGFTLFNPQWKDQNKSNLNLKLVWKLQLCPSSYLFLCYSKKIVSTNWVFWTVSVVWWERPQEFWSSQQKIGYAV